jgi:hypothetical protein
VLSCNAARKARKWPPGPAHEPRPGGDRPRGTELRRPVNVAVPPAPRGARDAASQDEKRAFRLLLLFILLPLGLGASWWLAAHRGCL